VISLIAINKWNKGDLDVIRMLSFYIQIKSRWR
jgi:hypothetical protein